MSISYNTSLVCFSLAIILRIISQGFEVEKIDKKERVEMNKKKHSKYRFVLRMMKVLFVFVLISSGMLSVPKVSAAAGRGTDFVILPEETTTFSPMRLMVRTLPKDGDRDTGLEWFRVPVSQDESYATETAFDEKYSTTAAADKASINGTNKSTSQVCYIDDLDNYGGDNKISQNGEYWVKTTFRDAETGQEFPIIHSIDLSSIFTQSVIERDGMDGQTGSELYPAEAVRTSGTNQDYITNQVGVALDLNGEVLASTVNGEEKVMNNPAGTFAELPVQPRILAPQYGIPDNINVPVNGTDLGTASFSYVSGQEVGDSVVSFHIEDNKWDKPEPVEGATVMIDGQNYLTDKDGNTEGISLKAPASYNYTVTGASSIPTSGTVYFTAEGQSINEEVTLQLTGPSISMVHGYVIDENGFPVPGATVSTPIDGYEVTTDDNGFYVLLQVKTGMADVKVSKSGFVSQQVPVATAAGTSVEQNFTLASGTDKAYTLSGIVADTTGTAVAGATVSAGGEVTTTDMYGAYSLGLIESGMVTVETSKPGYTTRVETVNVTQDMSYNIQLDKYTAVSFNVYDKYGAPAEGASVHINEQTYTTNKNGMTEAVPVAENGTYSYTVTKEGYKDATGVLYVTSEQEVIYEYVILEPLPITPVAEEAEISFNVRDNQGVPVQGATVEVNGQTVQTNEFGNTEAITIAKNSTYPYTITKEGYMNTTGVTYSTGVQYVYIRPSW